MTIELLNLSEDILLSVLQHLQVNSILSIRQTCRRLNELTRYRSVWLSACNRLVIEKGLPFPYTSLDDLDAVELERRTRRALALRNAWTRPDRQPHHTLSFMGGPLNGLHSVHFMLRREHEWIITLSEGIWPVIACWDLQCIENQAPTKVGEWFCKGATIKDVAVDSNITSDACLAVSLDHYSLQKRYIEVQSIRPVVETHETVVFETIKVLDTDYSPILLDGDILVVSDEYSEARVLNWRTEHYAILKGTEEPDEVIQHNKCLQILFAHESIFVARSRSIDLFPDVVLRSPDETVQVVHPLQTCTFGWIDGIAIAPLPAFIPTYLYTPIVIIVRAEQGDPWASDIHSVKYYMISPNPAYPSTDTSAGSSSPYLFPPVPISTIPARRDFMRCPTLALGSAGTALWMSSNIDRSRSQELCTMIWPGPIWNSTNRGERHSADLLISIESGGELWTSMDYVESRGCIALGAVDGSVKLLYMV